MDEKNPAIVEATLEHVKGLFRLTHKVDVQGVGIEEIIEGCELFRLINAPAEFAYAVKKVGHELWIQAAAGRGGMDLTALGLSVIELQAQDNFKSIGFQTRRRGLVRKAAALGYEIDGYILRKRLPIVKPD